jgi:hypothetical protein
VRRRRGHLLRLGTPSPITPAVSFAVTSAVGEVLVLVLVRMLLSAWGRSGAWELRTRAISDRDQECGNVFAVLARLLERRARAVRRDALSAQTNGDGVRIRIGTANLALRGRFVHVDVFDDLALLVIQAAQERAGPEQASQASVREGRQGVG